MVSLKAIRAASSSLPRRSPVAIFVGSTSGIGLGTIEALLHNSDSPRVIIIGRSRSRFSATLQRLQELNPKAKINFIEAEVSFLREVDRVCSLIVTEHTNIDYLWLSQGGLANGKGSLSTEGLNEDLAICYYSRLLFMQRLIPLLNKSPSDPRIVSVLSAGQEGTPQASDLGLLNSPDFGVFPTMKHNVTMMSLAMRELALQNSKISFIHTNPGMVSTAVHDRWIDGWTGPWAVLGWLMRLTFVPLMHSLGYTPSEAGEIGFFELSDARFAANTGTNFFRLSEKAEVLSTPAVLKNYEDDGFGKKVLEHTLQVNEKVLSL